MKNMRCVLLLVLLMPLANGFLQPQSVQQLEAEVSVTGGGQINGDLHNYPVELRVLSIDSTNRQTVSNRREILTINGHDIIATHETDENRNPLAHFTIRETGAFIYSITAHVIVEAPLLGVDDANLPTEPDLACDVPSPLIESNDPVFQGLVQTKFASKRWLESAMLVNSWVHQSVTYDTTFYPANYSALQTLQSRRGTCDEFAALAAALLRAKGICTRVIIGPVYSGNAWGYHAWLEARQPATGQWIPLDPTFGELGTVDATHIELGAFNDASAATERMFGPTTASIILDTKNVNVKIEHTGKYDNRIGLAYENLVLSNREWNSVEVNVRNPLPQFLVVPLEPRFPIGTRDEPESMTLLLQPFEHQKAIFSVFPDYNMKSNQYLEGNYTVQSLGPDLNASLRVNWGAIETNTSGLAITDLTPIYQKGQLQLELTLQNRGDQNTWLTANSPANHQTYSIATREKKTVQFITDANGPTITIWLESPDFNQTLEISIPKIRLPDKNVNFPKPDLNRPGVMPIENTPPTVPAPETPVNYLKSPYTVALLGGAIIIIVFLLDELFNKK